MHPVASTWGCGRQAPLRRRGRARWRPLFFVFALKMRPQPGARPGARRRWVSDDVLRSTACVRGNGILLEDVSKKRHRRARSWEYATYITHGEPRRRSACRGLLAWLASNGPKLWIAFLLGQIRNEISATSYRYKAIILVTLGGLGHPNKRILLVRRKQMESATLNEALGPSCVRQG